MFFEKILQLIRKKIKLFPLLLIPPVIIPLIAIFTVILTYFIFSQRIIFIYDPYTLRISNYNISQIKKIGIKNHLFIKPVEATYENFPKIYEKLSDREKGKKIVITAYLYSMFKDDEEYKTFFNNSRLFIYGPLFDYEKSANSMAFSLSISNESKLKQFLKESEKLNIYLPESIFEKAVLAEPETTLISLFKEIFYSINKDQGKNENIKVLPFTKEMEKSKIPSENSTITLLCLRKITPGNIDLIKESGGKVVFFDYINSRNLKNSLYIKEDALFSASISYDYKNTLDKVFKVMGKKTEISINYIAVFSFFYKK